MTAFARYISTLVGVSVVLMGWSLAMGQTTVAITEYINDVSGTESTDEWVEIFNYGSYAVNLNGWTIADEDSDFDPVGAFSLSSGQYAILAKDKSAFEAQWLGGIPNASVFEVSGLTLANSSDEITLIDSTSTQRWSLAYADDDSAGRATFLSVDDFSTTAYGTKAAPGVNRNGVDVPAGNLGYESNSATTDALATTQSGDTGSPLAGHYTVVASVGPSIFSDALPGAGDSTLFDFNDFTGAGFDPNPTAGQLDSDNFSVTGLSDGDLSFGGTATTGDFARGENDGAVSTAGIYAFDPNNDDNRALGVQPAGSDFTPGAITLRLPNETGEVVNELTVSADILVNNDEERSSSFVLEYSTDGINFVLLDSLTSPETSDSDGFTSVAVAASLAGLDIQPGDFLFLRATGDDVGGSGSRDEFAIDNLLISQPESATVPEPASLVMFALAGFVGLLGMRLTRK